MAYTGSGTQADPYLVGTIDDLASAMGQANTVYIKMTNDIDWTGRSKVSYTSLTNFSTEINIDGNGTSWTNIALINCTMFYDNRNNSDYDYKLVKFSNINIEATQIIDNIDQASSYIANDYYKNFFIAGANHSILFSDCNIRLKLYQAVFTVSSISYKAFCGLQICTNYENNSGQVDPVKQDLDLLVRTNLTIDVYCIGPYGGFILNIGRSISTRNHYIKDSIIKISYYDENGWGTTGDAGNFVAGSDNPGRAGWSMPIIRSIYDWTYNRPIIANTGIFIRYYANTNLNDKRSFSILGGFAIVNSYIVYECMGSVYIKPRISECKFNTYAFYDIDKAPTLVQNENSYALSSSQFVGLTTAQCKSRLSFEGPDAIIPFKLKQTT